MHVLGDADAGKMYADTTIAMIERLKSETNVDLIRSPIHSLYGFLLYWIVPVQSYTNVFHEASLQCLRTGDAESACWDLYLHCVVNATRGEPLSTVSEDCRSGIVYMVALERRFQESGTRILWQTVLNLMDESLDDVTVTQLTGIAMDEKLLLQENEFSKVAEIYRLCKIILHTYIGEFEEAAQLAIVQGDRMLKESPGATFGMIDPYFRGLCLYAAAKYTGRASYKRHGNKARAMLQRWLKKGNPNIAHHLKLLDAEHSSCSIKSDPKDVEQVKKLYAEACQLASDMGFVQDAGMAYERYGEYLLTSSSFSKNDMEDAAKQLANAVDCYARWGAAAKVKRLEDKYRSVLDRSE